MIDGCEPLDVQSSAEGPNALRVDERPAHPNGCHPAGGGLRAVPGRTDRSDDQHPEQHGSDECGDAQIHLSFLQPGARDALTDPC